MTALAGLRARLIAMVILAMIPALILILYTASQQRQADGAAAQEAALNTARLAADHYRRSLDSTHQLLAALSLLDEIAPGENSDCAQLFATLLKEYQIYANLFVTRADGSLVCSALPAPAGVNYADRGWFRQVIDGQRFAIGDYAIGLVTNTAVVELAHPVIGADGRSTGAVAASLDLTWLQQFATTAHVPSGWTMAVLDASGTPLAGYPADTYLGGDPEPGNASLAHLAIGSPTGLATGADTPPMEGVFEGRDLSGGQRLYAYVAVAMPDSSGSLTVLVSTPVQLAFLAANQALARSLAWLGVAVALAILGAWLVGDLFVLRPVRQLQTAVHRLSAGDLDARTAAAQGVSELRDVARAFNQMAQTIQQRETDLKQAHDHLEQRVEERTAELNAANSALQNEMVIGQRKEAALRLSQAQLLQAEKMAALGRLAAALAHEINNPLQAIQTYLELLTIGVDLDADTRTAYLGTARSEIERLGRLVGRILDFARPAHSPRAPVSLVRAVEQTLALSNKRLQQAHVVLKTDLQPVPDVIAASDQLVQVFINLLVNAIESVPPGGTIAIATACGKDGVSVSFANDGSLIPEEDLRHIFEPFFTTKPGGTGLGLSICHSLVAEHRGQLSVRNNADGRGVTFVVTLPVPDGPSPDRQTEAANVG